MVPASHSSSPRSSDFTTRATEVADTVLFPAADTIEESGHIPPELLNVLAARGLYALGAPAEIAAELGITAPDDATRAAVVEALAGGCLSVAFVWLQHRGALRAVAGSAHASLRDNFLRPMAAGEIRGGLAIGAATRSDHPLMHAEKTPTGWRFSGKAPWVTGWGMIDVLLLAARTDDDQLVWALVDAADSDSLRASPLRLIAVQASGTVQVDVHDLVVPNDRVVLLEPYAEYRDRDVMSLAFNGFLAVGAASRAIRLLGPELAGDLVPQRDAVRARLLAGELDDVPAARAAASDLAMRSATALAVHEGARSVLAGSTASRLIREATFLLSFGTRATIRAALLERVTAAAARAD